MPTNLVLQLSLPLDAADSKAVLPGGLAGIAARDAALRQE
jgi:hypothetical protein